VKPLNAKIAEVVRAAAGEDAIKLVKILASCRNVSQCRIVKSARIDIQKVRNLLYRLHSSNLADYKRVKDNKKGIYVSYWTFNRAMVEELFSKLHQEKLQKFRERLDVETSNLNGFFICPAACTRADFARAEQQRFRCEECGKLLAQEDNTRTIDVLRGKIREMEAAVA
jgi:transcription factor E